MSKHDFIIFTPPCYIYSERNDSARSKTLLNHAVMRGFPSMALDSFPKLRSTYISSIFLRNSASTLFSALNRSKILEKKNKQFSYIVYFSISKAIAKVVVLLLELFAERKY